MEMFRTTAAAPAAEPPTPPAPFSLKETAAVAAVVIQLVLGAVAYGRLDQAVTTLREDVREIRNVILKKP